MAQILKIAPEYFKEITYGQEMQRWKNSNKKKTVEVVAHVFSQQVLTKIMREPKAPNLMPLTFYQYGTLVQNAQYCSVWKIRVALYWELSYNPIRKTAETKNLSFERRCLLKHEVTDGNVTGHDVTQILRFRNVVFFNVGASQWEDLVETCQKPYTNSLKMPGMALSQQLRYLQSWIIDALSFSVSFRRRLKNIPRTDTKFEAIKLQMQYYLRSGIWKQIDTIFCFDSDVYIYISIFFVYITVVVTTKTE